MVTDNLDSLQINAAEPHSKDLIKDTHKVSVTSESNTPIAPADLHGMWYPTVRRALICLSKLSRCLDVGICFCLCLNYVHMLIFCKYICLYC